jgi:ketosteroid isomerase-like protein
MLKFPQANPRLRHTMIISIVKALLIASVPTLLSVSNAAPNEEQSTGPLSAVHAFQAALAHGDAKAALALLAEDAVILEAGSAQTRDEYAGEHLGEDIAFAKGAQTTRANETVYHEGGVSWTTATTRTQGNFNGRKIDSSGVELIVLTKQDGKWRIRAIHWSSHANKIDQIK